MSWGGGPAGSTAWGDGDGAVVPSMQLIAGEAVRENVIRLTFSTPVYFSRWHDPRDASFIDRYTVTADTTTTGLDGVPARPVFPADVQPVLGAEDQIDIWLDRPLSSYGAKYRVAVTGLQSSTGLPLDVSAATVVVDGVLQGLPILTPDQLVGNRDIANPQSLSMLGGQPAVIAALGVYQYDDTGDIGIDAGLVSYKKRVFRRLTTRKGAFAHMPGYGVSIPQSIKKLARANLVDGIASDAEDQIRQEPETKSVTVRLVPHPEAPGLFVYRITATTTFGQLQDFDVPVPLAA
jgi:hypothetical protein